MKSVYQLRSSEEGFEDVFNWNVTLYAGEHTYRMGYRASSYQSESTVYLNHDGSPYGYAQYVDMNIGPNVYTVTNGQPQILAGDNGMFWRCVLPEQSQQDETPQDTVPFDCRSITGIEITGTICTGDTAYNLDYYRNYEIAGELPEQPQEEQSQQMLEFSYEAGIFEEKYGFTTTRTEEGVHLTGEYLDIFFSNNRELTVTMNNVIVNDRYLIQPSGDETGGYVRIGWMVELVQPDGKIMLETEKSTIGKGGDYWIAPEFMPPDLRWNNNPNTAYRYGMDNPVKQQFTKGPAGSICWKCVLPEQTSENGYLDPVPLALDPEAITKIEASFWNSEDGKERIWVGRTYKPES